jgi:hypothetical protein
MSMDSWTGYLSNVAPPSRFCDKTRTRLCSGRDQKRPYRPIVGQLLCHERGHNRCQITIREPETNFYVRILFPLAPFPLFLFETTAGNFYAKNSVCGLSYDLSLQAEAEKFMAKLSD